MLTDEKLAEMVKAGAPVLEIIREFTREAIADMLMLEARQFIDERQETMADGKARLVLHGTLPDREVLLPMASVRVSVPRVRDRQEGGEKLRFESKLLPRYLRRTSDFEDLIPWMYLKGFSESDFQPFFEQALGCPVPGMSRTSISNMLNSWAAEFASWESRDMSRERYAYIWADGVYFKVKGERDNVCQMVALGVGEDGSKTLVGLQEGYAETSDSWHELFAKAKSRGMEAPKLVIGDGGLGLWSGLARVYPDAGRQECWVHRMASVRNNLPKGRQMEAIRQIRDIYMSDTRDEAARKIESLGAAFRLKQPKAEASLTRHSDKLLAFYDYPAEHWRQLRTTNPIESMFSTLRRRTGKMRGQLGKRRLGALILKLAQTATSNMHALPHADKIKLLMDGGRFKDGELAAGGPQER